VNIADQIAAKIKELAAAQAELERLREATKHNGANDTPEQQAYHLQHYAVAGHQRDLDALKASVR
jgi:hypothetical protein